MMGIHASLARVGVVFLLFVASHSIQANTVLPATGASCTASALNRNAALGPDYNYRLFNVPVDQGPIKVRVTCSDGTVGQTGYELPVVDGTTFTGDIVFGQLDPIPLAISLSAPTARLTQAGQTLQLATTAVNPDGTTRDITKQAAGTFYTSSNTQLATVTADGLVTVTPLFAPSSSARIVLTATNEGLATNYVLTLGPQGRLRGTVYRADGTTPVPGALVTVQRNQPLEQVGTYTTDTAGAYDIVDVAGGSFTLSVIDPATGDRGRGFGAIRSDGETARIDVPLNGQGNVLVQVIDGTGAPVAGVPVTLTSLTTFRDTRTTETDVNGRVSFTAFPAGDLTASTRQASTNLLGTALGRLGVNGDLTITLKLQPVGSLAGTVYATDGATPQAGVQVKLLSASKGLVTQVVTGEDGAFTFDSLPLSDSPYTLDAVQHGQLRARAAGIVLSSAGQQYQQNLVLTPVGTVAGQVLTPGGAPAANAPVTVQALGGLRTTFNTSTDSSGGYRVEGVPQGNFAVVASAAGATGTAAGAISTDGQLVTVDVRLRANGVVGVVYQRDGQTPVGAGVTVTLNPGAHTATTDAQGGFAFAAVTPNSYTLDAADGQGNRGRTQLVVTTVDATKALVANIAFLGRGRVTGVVRDANGDIQANQAVTLASQSIFGGAASATTDSAGRYQIDGVFVGDFTVSAQNSVTRLAGSAKGALLGDGDIANADVTLRATGSVTGRVIRSDGVTALPGAQVELRIGGSVFATTTADANADYRFDLVPLGDFALLVTDPQTGDKGLTNSRLTTLNEVRTANVRLVGQGQVTVHVTDGNGQPVAGARVSVNSASLFGGSYSAASGTDGMVSFGPVFSGDFTVSATKAAQVGVISGSGSGTVVPGGTTQVTITLTSRPVGRITGIVYAPDAATPLAGVTLRLAPFNREITSGIDGSYAFNDLEGGTTFSVSALVNGRVRARSGNVQITVNDEILTQDLTLIGVGSVQGRVTNASQQGVGGITVRLNNPDPVLGGLFTTTTQTDGSYSFAQIPAGNFFLTATNAEGTLRAEGAGRIGFDGDSATVGLALVDNAITMPRTLYDANNFQFDVQGNGAIGAGTRNVYSGNGGADRQGMRLEIVSAGVPIPFTNGNGSIGSIGVFGQQVEVDELNALGLNVSRRVYVPKGSYFVRYLEVLENRGSSPITVDVRVVTNISQGDGNPRVADTSDGDDVLSVADAANRDRWVVVDDLIDADPFQSPSIPAIAHVFDGAGAPEQVAQAGLSLVGQVGKLQWQWSSVTVSPGGTVAYMHFGVQQLSRAAARNAALRLAQLPPEALEGLTPVELSAIRNFAVPLDGTSAVEPLPSVGTAVINGQVRSGDNITPISGASVQIQSEHPLFRRVYGVNSDGQGMFQLKAKANGDGHAIAIPIGPFSMSARHPQTGETTPAAPVNFPAGAAEVTHDLVFINTGNIRGTVARHNGSLVTGGTVRVYLPDVGYINAAINGSGIYGFTGIKQGDYVFEAQVPHPQGQPLTGTTVASLVAGQTSIGNITIQPTGTITGTVLAFGGEPVVNAVVTLDSYSYPYRSTRTDTAGRFTFTDVAVGGHAVYAAEPRTGTLTSIDTVVGVDQTEDVVLTHPGVGTINVQVNFQRGGGAPNAYVWLGGHTARTDSSGRAQFTETVGSYTASVQHPDNGRLSASADAVLSTDGEVVQTTITLPAAGTVSGIVFRADGVTRAHGLGVSLLSFNPTQGGQALTATTDAQGAYRIVGVPEGGFYVKVVDSQNATFADASGSISADGQDFALNLTLANNTVPLPVSRYDANNFISDVQQNGAILSGHAGVFSTGTAPRRGASLLEIIDGGSSHGFTGNTNATLGALGRQLTILQPTTIAGLRVSRKIFVPSNGYFTRYLEILENPTAAAITVDVNVATRYRTTSNLLLTSSGDAVLDVGADPDRWALLDDADFDPFLTSSLPTTVHVYGMPGAARTADAADFRLEGDGARSLSYRFNDITVPAGGKVALMHFVVQQVNRAGAQAAAERLVQLPPEALESLEPDEIVAVANMAVPADGVGLLAPLPALTGTIAGRVLEGDNATSVSGAYIRVRSNHPLYNRTWQYYGWWGQESTCGQNYVDSLVSGATGAYSLVGRLIEGRSVPIPVDSGVAIQVVPDGCSTQSQGHPLTGVDSPIYAASLTDGSVTQDIVFPTGILTGTVVGPADFGVTSGQVAQPGNAQVRNGSVGIRNDATYTYPGLALGTYSLTASVPHSQGTGLKGVRSDAVVTVGRVTVTDIRLEATGAISGAVVTANGEAAANALVKITGTNGFYRQTYSDSLGRYALTAVPIGSYEMTVKDAASGAYTPAASVAVGENQTTTQNVALLGLGAVQLQVNYARGVGAFDAPVYLRSAAIGPNEFLAGRTDLNGHVTVARIPVGDFTLRARHPAVSAFDTAVAGTITANGDVLQQTVTLRPVAAVQLTVLNRDTGNTPAGGASVSLTDSVYGNHVVGTTDAAGVLTIPTVPEGPYTIAVVQSSTGATGGVSGTVGIVEDGRTIDHTVSITADRALEGVLAYASERDLYSIRVNAGDVISIRINGTAVGTAPSLYRTRAQLYNPSRTRLAQGYGYDARNNNAQYNEYGNLSSTTASVAGYYTIAVSGYYTSDTGGYRLSVSVNGVPVAIEPYANGGAIVGHVYRGDGTTPVANQRLNLTTSGNPALNANVVTDEAGAYRFTGVPLAGYTLKLTTADGRTPLQRTGQLSSTNPYALDLTLPLAASLSVAVVDAAGAAVGQGVQVRLTDAAGARSFYTDSTGRVSASTWGSVTIGAYHPQNGYLISSSTTAPTVDQEALSVTATLPAVGSVTGHVTAGGLPVVNAYVRIQYLAGCCYRTSAAYTGADGAYMIDNLPIGANLSVYTQHPQNSNLSASADAVLTVHAETVTVDLFLPAVASVSGRVLHASGAGASSSYVRAIRQSDYTQLATTYSDASGNYSFAALETGVPMLIRAQNPSTAVWSTTELTLSDAGQVVTGHDISVGGIGAVTGQVSLASGAPVANVQVRATYTYDPLFNNTTTRYAATDVNGTYRFDNMPVGQAIRLDTSHPNVYGLVAESEVTLATDGEVLAAPVLTHVGSGSVIGRVVSTAGTPVANANVRAGYVYDTVNNYYNYYYARTNANGDYRIDNLPVGRAVGLRAQHPKINATSDTSVILATDGEVATAPVLTLPIVGQLRVAVVDAEGAMPAGYVYIYLRDSLSAAESYKGYLHPSNNTLLLIANVPEGAYTLRAVDSNTGNELGRASGEITSEAETPVRIVASLIKGVVRFPDDTPVPYPNVFITQIDAAGNVTTYYPSSTEADGSYRVLGVTAADYTMTAQDPESGLQAAVAGTLAAVDTPQTTDVTLPPSGTVTGTVRDAAGSVVPYAEIALVSSSLNYTRYAGADDQGRYVVNRVALGTVTVHAYDRNSRYRASASGLLQAADATAIVDVTMPAGAAVTGRVLQPDASTPVANASFTVQSMTDGPFGSFSASGRADGEGAYSLAAVPAGGVSVIAYDPASPLAGLATGTVGTGSASIIDVVLGNASRFDVLLDGSDGYRYDVGCAGYLIDGGTVSRSETDAYDGAYYLYVGSSGMPCSDVALLEDDQREAVIGPRSLNGLEVTRKVFSPARGGYARYLEILRNTGTADITVPVEIRSYLGSDSSTRIVVHPSAAGNKYAVTDQRGYCCDPALAHVFGGIGAALDVAALRFVEEDDNLSYTWNVTVPAGQTVILMHFAAQRSVSDTAGAEAQAQALVNMIDTYMFDGMSAAERAQVLNFAVP